MRKGGSSHIDPNGFYRYGQLPLKDNPLVKVVVSKKGRCYEDKYSVFLLKTDKHGTILYESHQLSHDKLKDARAFQEYVAKYMTTNWP